MCWGPKSQNVDGHARVCKVVSSPVQGQNKVLISRSIAVQGDQSKNMSCSIIYSHSIGN